MKTAKIAIKKEKQVVVGMSGGVDSSMALLLLKQRGWQPIGLSLKYAVWENKENLLRENICCSAASFKAAEAVCRKLEIPHYVIDVGSEFKREVIGYFLSELKHNRTPNPCIICNRYLKFKQLIAWAQKHKIRYVATGHYARIKKNYQSRQYELWRPRDKDKDQTYSLCFLLRQWLGRIIFPLEDYTKDEVYALAEREGFVFFSKQKQSQDFCFVAGKSLPCFLARKIGIKKGVIKDGQGNVLGRHRGLHFYTIGQRKGINLSGGPYFVVGFNARDNVLVVSREQSALLSREAVLSPCHFFSGRMPEKKMKIKAKIRSRHFLADAILIPAGGRKVKIMFHQPQKSLTPGQFAVFYNNDICLGGGRIKTVIAS